MGGKWEYRRENLRRFIFLPFPQKNPSENIKTHYSLQLSLFTLLKCVKNQTQKKRSQTTRKSENTLKQ